MFKSLVACLAFAAGAAYADGVPLITPGGNVPGDARLKNLGVDVVRVHPMKLNPSAFGANVLTVVVDGKEYRFIGTKAKPVDKDTESWVGIEKRTNTSDATLTITRPLAGGPMVGIMYLPPNRLFEIAPSGLQVMVERDLNLVSKHFEEPTYKLPAPAIPASGARQ